MKGRLQFAEVDLVEIGRLDFAEHEIGIDFREHAAEGSLVLAQGYALLQPFVGRMLQHPRKGIFAGGVDAVALREQRVGLFVGNETERPFGRGGQRGFVAEHGRAAFNKIIPKFPGHVLFVKNDHAVLTGGSGSARHALG